MNSSVPDNLTNASNRPQVDAHFLTFAFVVDAYVETAICALGIVANSLVVYVLRRDDLYPAIRLLYQLLGMADILYLTVCLVFKVLNMVQYWTSIISRFAWSVLDLYYSPFLSISQGLADWHVVLVSLGTYVAVCKPQWAKRHLNTRNVWILSATMWTLSLIYHIPMFLEFRVTVADRIHVQSNGSYNVTYIYRSLIREPILNRHEIYRTIYHIFGFMAFRFILPVCLLIFANVAVIREIHRLNALRKTRNGTLLGEHSNGGGDQGGQDQRSPRKYVRLLKTVVAVYLLCALPHFAVRTMFLCLPKGLIRLMTMNSSGHALSYLSVFTSLMYKVNSCCFIIIFSVLRQSFRHLMYLACTCQLS